jgi:hypothetical protein
LLPDTESCVEPNKFDKPSATATRHTNKQGQQVHGKYFLHRSCQPHPTRARNREQFASGNHHRTKVRPDKESVMSTDPNNDVPHWAATAGHRSLAQRVAAHGSRLLGSSRRRPTDGRSSLATDRSDVPGTIRQPVLCEDNTDSITKARHTSEDLVRAGFNTGTVPYGYRAQRIQVSPQGQRPRWRTRLVIEPVEAATVKMIFVWRGGDGLTIEAIYKRLISARYPAPLDPETQQPGACSHSVIRAILRNPKYLGRQVWGRRRHGRRIPSDGWLWSPEWAHPPIVSTEEFVAANRRTLLAATIAATNCPAAGRTDQRSA